MYKNVPDVWFDTLDKLREEYEFGRMLGSGVYADVFVVKNRATGENSAAKHFSKRTTISEANQIHFAPDHKALLEEVAILKLLGGRENCMRLNGVLETPHDLYVLCELCDNDLMSHVSSLQHVTEEDASGWSAGLLSAVAHCHRNYVMHRDLKPENLLVGDRLILGDFGSAVRFKRDERFNVERGSSFWSSPETWANDYDYRADNWSCGLIILVLVDGMMSSGQIKELHALGLDAAFAHGVKYDQKTPHELSADLKFLLKGLLSRNPNKRLSAEDALKLNWVKRKQTHNVLSSAKANAGAYVSARQLERSLHAAFFTLLTETQRSELHKRLQTQNHFLLDKEESKSVDDKDQIVVSSKDLMECLEGFPPGVEKILKDAPPNTLLHVALSPDTAAKRRLHRRSSSSAVKGLDNSGHPLLQPHLMKSITDDVSETPPQPRPTIFKSLTTATMDATW